MKNNISLVIILVKIRKCENYVTFPYLQSCNLLIFINYLLIFFAIINFE